MSTHIQNRYEFVYLFDVINGNPNGDPDAGNMPRLDPVSSCGLITDVSLKRKIRNFISMTEVDSAGKENSRFKIFVKEKSILNQQIGLAYESELVKKALVDHEAHGALLKAYKQDLKKYEKDLKSGKATSMDKPLEPIKPMHYEDIAQQWMCDNFFDVRMFGAVMSTGSNTSGKEEGAAGDDEQDEKKSKLVKRAGQVRGPVQFAFGKSIDPIVPLEISITRMAVTSEKESEAQGGGNRTMGRKHIVPYGLYRAHGFVSANLAGKTGFSEDDLSKLWQSLMLMFDHDRSAARGEMAARHLVVFKHATALGNAPAHQLFERVTVERVHGESGSPAAQFSDYAVKVDGDVLKQYRKDVDVV